MRYSRPIYIVFLGLIVFTGEFLQACSSAVDICRIPCEPGKFCHPFLGFCISCKEYCQGQNDCLTTCANNKPTTMMPTSTTQLTGVITSYSMTSSTSTAATASYPTNKPSALSEKVTNALLPEREHLELSLELVFSSLFSMLFLVIIVGVLVLYRKTLKMPNLCGFSNGDSPLESEDIEFGEINHSPVEGQPRIWVNRIVERSEYAPVQVDDDEDNSVIQPGPSGISGQNSIPRPHAGATYPTDPIPTTSVSRSGRGDAEPYQSARVHQASAPSLECQGHLGAVPADHSSNHQKTPETHRKITDGTLDGHEFAPGASRFGPYLPHQLEDFQWTREPGHGD